MKCEDKGTFNILQKTQSRAMFLSSGRSDFRSRQISKKRLVAIPLSKKQQQKKKKKTQDGSTVLLVDNSSCVTFSRMSN